MVVMSMAAKNFIGAQLQRSVSVQTVVVGIQCQRVSVGRYGKAGMAMQTIVILESIKILLLFKSHDAKRKIER